MFCFRGFGSFFYSSMFVLYENCQYFSCKHVVQQSVLFEILQKEILRIMNFNILILIIRNICEMKDFFIYSLFSFFDVIWNKINNLTKTSSFSLYLHIFLEKLSLILQGLVNLLSYPSVKSNRSCRSNRIDEEEAQLLQGDFYFHSHSTPSFHFKIFLI